MTTNPSFKFTKEDVEQNAGKTLAIDVETGDILAVRACIEILDHVMRTMYPGVSYAKVTMPELFTT